MESRGGHRRGIADPRIRISLRLDRQKARAGDDPVFDN
jgi:hypothetical protein